MYKYNKIGVLNEKRCKELLFGSCYSFENIYVTLFPGSAGGVHRRSTGGSQKWFDDSFLKSYYSVLVIPLRTFM